MPRIHEPGHCKLTAQRIRRDAERLAKRLADGERLVEIAGEYPCTYNTFIHQLKEALGDKRWRQLVHRGVRSGEFFGRRFDPNGQTPSEEGPICWYCMKPIGSDTPVCPNCGTLQQG